MPSTIPFRIQLATWRTSVGVSQAALDARLGRKRGFIGQLESGKIRAPGRDDCFEIGAALGIAGELVWDAARAERLRELDPDLFEYYAREAVEGGALTAEEQELIETLRWLDHDLPPHDGVTLAEHLNGLALSTLVDASAPEKSISALGRETLQAVRRLEALRDEDRRGVARVLVAACGLVARA